MRASLLLVVSWFLAACSGGGGGPAAAPLTLVLATFVGAGSAPAAGDQLLLFLSRDVALTGALLDDEDLSLSGGSLGAVPAPPVRLSSRLVLVILGPGTSFVPGVTTAAFAPTNDAVLGADGSAPEATSRVIALGDGDAPAVSSLTLNRIDPELNGTGAAGGTLQVPRTGFTIDVGHTDPTSPIAGGLTVIAASVAVQVPSGTVAAGENLVPHLVRTGGGPMSQFRVPQGVAFGLGAVALTVFVVDGSGMVSAPATFDFLSRHPDNGVRPFEWPQVWFLDVQRDVESFVHDLGRPLHPVQILRDGDGEPVPNGRSDLYDLYEIVGLLGADGSVNTTVVAMLREEIVAQLDALYAGAGVTFTFTKPGTFPGGGATIPYSANGFSQICIGGAADETGTSGVLGAALFDPRNGHHDNDCLLEFGGTQRLGVFMHTMINDGLRPPSLSSFRGIYDPLTPGFAGVPIGNSPGDAARLGGAIQDARATTIHRAIDFMGRVIAVITAHECGHSMGLVADGPMPTGLYGNSQHFPGSSSGHIRTPSLFPPGATNVMTPTLSFDTATDPDTAFNSLNLAYLREQALYQD